MLVTLLRMAAALPLPFLHAAGRLLGRLAYAFPGKYRDRLRANAARPAIPSPPSPGAPPAKSGP